MTAQCIDCKKLWSISKYADNHMYICPVCTIRTKKRSLPLAKGKGSSQGKPACKNSLVNNTKKNKKRKEA